MTFVCSPFEHTYFESAAKQFHQNNPDIDIKILSSSDIFSALPTDSIDMSSFLEQLAQQADVFLWSVDGVADGQAALVKNLTPFIDSDVNWEQSTFFSEMLSSFTVEGNVWGIPYSVDPSLVVYDPQVFREMSMELPKHDWTWSDFIAAAQTLTSHQEQVVSRYGFTDFGLLGANAAIFPQDMPDITTPSSIMVLDAPHIVASVKQHVSLSLENHVWLGIAPTGNSNAIEMIQRGEAAMGIVSSKTWLAAYDESLSTLDIILLPDSGAVHLTGLFMSRGTSYAEAAWRWIAYLSQHIPPQQALPARRNLLSKSVSIRQMPQSFKDVVMPATEHYHAPLYPNKLTLLLRRALEQALAGKDVVAALAEAQVYWEKSDSKIEETEFSVPTPLVPSVLPANSDDLKDRELITFVTSEKWLYESLIEAFHEQQTHIGVVIEEPIFDNMEDIASLSAQLQHFAEADCFLSSISPQFAFVRERILNLTPLAEANVTFPLEDYTTQALGAAMHEGELWGLPAGLKPSVLWYNPVLFDKAGLSPPQPNWTWNDVLQAAQALSIEEGDLQNYGLAIFPYQRLWMFFESAAGPLWDTNTVPQTPQFNMPEKIATAERLAHLVDTAVIPNAAFPEAQQTVRRLISENRVAMWIMGARECEFVEGKIFPDTDTTCLPASLPKSNSNWGTVLPQIYYISANTEHAEACWQWLRFVSDHVLPYHYLPPRVSLTESDTFGELVGLKAQSTYLEVSARSSLITLSDIDADHDFTFRALTWLEQALAEIIWQGGDAEAYLNLAAYRAEAYVACLRRCQNIYDQECADTCFSQANVLE